MSVYGIPGPAFYPEKVLLVFITFRDSERAEAFETLVTPDNVDKELIGLKEFKRFLEIDNGGLYNKAIIVTDGNIVNQMATSGFQQTMSIQHDNSLSFDRYLIEAERMLAK